VDALHNIETIYGRLNKKALNAIFWIIVTVEKQLQKYLIFQIHPLNKS